MFHVFPARMQCWSQEITIKFVCLWRRVCRRATPGPISMTLCAHMKCDKSDNMQSKNRKCHRSGGMLDFFSLFRFVWFFFCVVALRLSVLRRTLQRMPVLMPSAAQTYPIDDHFPLFAFNFSFVIVRLLNGAYGTRYYLSRRKQCVEFGRIHSPHIKDKPKPEQLRFHSQNQKKQNEQQHFALVRLLHILHFVIAYK